MNELTEEAKRIARSYTPQLIYIKTAGDTIYKQTIRTVPGTLMVGFFGKNNLPVFDGDVYQFKNDEAYYQMRWDPKEYWLAPVILQADPPRDHWAGLSWNPLISIRNGHPYKFKNIYRVVPID